MPRSPDPLRFFTTSPMTFFASPNSMSVLSAKYSSFSMPANPGFIDRLMASTTLALSASMIGMPKIGLFFRAGRPD